MCGTINAVSSLVGAAGNAIGSVMGMGAKPDTAAIQAQAKEAAKAETAAATAKAAQDSSAKLAARNRARATSLLSTGAPADSGMTTVGTKTTLGQ